MCCRAVSSPGSCTHGRVAARLSHRRRIKPSDLSSLKKKKIIWSQPLNTHTARAHTTSLHWTAALQRHAPPSPLSLSFLPPWVLPMIRPWKFRIFSRLFLSPCAFFLPSSRWDNLSPPLGSRNHLRRDLFPCSADSNMYVLRKPDAGIVPHFMSCSLSMFRIWSFFLFLLRIHHTLWSFLLRTHAWNWFLVIFNRHFSSVDTKLNMYCYQIRICLFCRLLSTG